MLPLHKMGTTKEGEGDSNRRSVTFAQENQQIISCSRENQIQQEDSSMVASSPPKSPRSPRSPRRNSKARNWWLKYYRAKEQTVEGSARVSRKAKGMRQARRIENWNHLVQLGENEELGELEIVDLVEPTVSVFAELLMENEKMKVWHDFVNHTEEDQQRMLDGFLFPEESDMEEEVEITMVTRENQQEDLDSWEVVDHDKRTVHPAFTAEQCFKRIDGGLRNLLKKRHVPLGALEHLEEEVTSFFREWPTSVFISQLPSSYERLLMHALCQYLSLTSRSFNDEKGHRQTQVENRHDFFSPPTISLWRYLEARH